MKKTYDIYQIDCANCALKIEKSLGEAEGVKAARVDFAKSKVYIESDEHIDIEVINQIAKKIESDVYIKEEHEAETEPSNRIDIKYVFWTIGIALLASVYIINHFVFLERNIFLLLNLLSYGLISYRIVYRAIKNLIKGQIFDEHILMTIATLGALILGEYIEAIAVMMFYQIGESFQDFAVNRSRKNIKALLDLKPPVAHKVVDKDFIDIHPERAEISDLLVVKAGEIIPTDSVLIEGESHFDFSSMTGESLPVESKKGMTLPAGVINLSKPIYVKVIKKFKDSSLQKMIDFVESNSMKKAKAEKFMSKFARYYTPTVVGAAMILAFIVPIYYMMIEGGTYASSLNIFIERALIFLVISCPCALVLSIPLSFYAGIGLSSKHGILVKSGSDLESIEQIEHFVFDKTGTLTKGEFSVVNVEGDSRVLEIAAHLESFSTHPIALSILRAYDKDINQQEVTDVEEVFGQGIRGEYKEQEVSVGNEKMLLSLGISHDYKSKDQLTIYVVLNKEVIGYIELEDVLKEGTQSLIKVLKDSGKEVSLVTGDQEKVSKKIAGQLGIDHVYAEVTPQDKAIIVQNLKAYQKTAFIGDGVNDAMVLMTADLGISMGSLGSDVAIEASDAVIMNDDPRLLLDAIEVSKATKRNVIENIWLALGIKSIVLILGALGFANMWLAIFADVGVSLIAVLNAMRLLRYKIKSLD